MNHGGLFEGIGGFSLAAEWMGWNNVYHVEKDLACQKVLKKRFPNTKLYGDIKKFKPVPGSADIITGGFPCQPFSQAGKRRSKEDDRFLWPEMLRVIQEGKPEFVVAENVTNIDGLALKEVLNDLEGEGYETLPPLEIEAASVGAFHRRNRVWIIAVKENPFNTNAHGIGSHRTEIDQQRSIEFQHEQISLPGSLVSSSVRQGIDSRVFRDVNGLSNRVDRLRQIGNSISPQVAFEIFKAIDELIIHDTSTPLTE
jgi:DNA (cytosine-5)-methyltransferase 1